ncbi:MAG: hypothetical protein GVY11_08025 [Gammaproteobacteria bacterium]|nr:hypothetical protein [Gammaproteobacteria bacterium]
MLALSLLLHAALFLLPLPDLARESPRSDNAAMIVDLLPRPADSEHQDPPQRTQPQRPSTEAPATPEEVKTHESRATAKTVSEQTTGQEPTSAPASADAILPGDRMQARILSAARAIGRDAEQTGEEKGLHYDSAPALPSQPGWLDRYTGPVTASIDRWKGNDGSRKTRIVTGSGQVFCVRTRAPTIAEIFNPWMSSAVGMVRNCGRERPRGAARWNPWLRSPGGAQRNGEE